MTRFIFICMAFIALSFMAVPAYFGIQKEHAILMQNDTVAQNNQSLSFEEIYAMADEDLLSNPAFLNNIAPAAGNNDDAPVQEDYFSTGFSGTADSALEEEIVLKTEIISDTKSAN